MRSLLLLFCLLGSAVVWPCGALGHSAGVAMAVRADSAGAGTLVGALEYLSHSQNLFSLEHDSLRIDSDTVYAQAVMRYAVAHQLHNTGYFVEANRLSRGTVAAFYSLGDFRQAFHSLLLQVSSLMHMGVYNEAFPAMLRAHNLAWNLHDSALIAMAQHWIGQLYMSQGNSAVAVLYYEDAVASTRRLGVGECEALLAQRLGHLAEAYVGAERYDEALRAAEEAIVLDTSQGGTLGGVRAELARGDAYMAMGTLMNAEHAYGRALAMSRALGYAYEEVLTLKQKGMLRLEQRRLPEADSLFAEAYVLAVRSDMHPLRLALLRKRAEVVRQVDPIRALGYLEAHTALADSLSRLSAQQQMSAMHARYESELKQHRIEVQELQLERESLLRNILIVSIVLALMAVFLLLFFLHHHRQRSRRLVLLNRTKDTFFSIISHDTKSVAVSIRNMLSQMEAHLEGLTKEQIARYIALLHEASEGETQLLDNLLQWAHVQLRTIRFAPAMQDVVPLVREVVSLFALSMAGKELRVEETYPERAEAWVDANMAELIVRNLLSNAIKYSPKGGSIHVLVGQREDGVHVCVRDEGIGMGAEQVAKLGSIDKRCVRRGTEGEQGTGLGLILCYSMAERIGARIQVDSTEGCGTAMSLVLRNAASRQGWMRVYGKLLGR